mmetsp:Transcript_28554/g.52138  ORF Transcript_28554/g.52138 Transcript_28554/m.52138 type:complete len:154 (-) Transcript_28554:1722-2183(-)
MSKYRVSMGDKFVAAHHFTWTASSFILPKQPKVEKNVRSVHPSFRRYYLFCLKQDNSQSKTFSESAETYSWHFNVKPSELFTQDQPRHHCRNRRKKRLLSSSNHKHSYCRKRTVTQTIQPSASSVKQLILTFDVPSLQQSGMNVLGRVRSWFL